MAPQSAPPQPPAPTFLRQGLLIVLPVIVLAAVGLFSLRQDKILAQHEAVERAQAIADEMAGRFWAALTAPGTDDLRLLKIDRTGRLVFPPSYQAWPGPRPLNPLALTAEQGRLWHSAQELERAAAPAPAVQVYQKFLAQSPPDDFAAAASYQAGLLSMRQGNTPAAAGLFRTVEEKYSRVTGESGLPLGPLAQLKLLELNLTATNAPLEPAGPLIDTLCSNAVLTPSPITALLLAKADILAARVGLTNITQQWRAEWEEHELARRLYAAAIPYLQPAPNSTQPKVRLASVEPAPQLLIGEVHGPIETPPRLFWVRPEPGPREERDPAQLVGQTAREGGREVSRDDQPLWLLSRSEEGTNGWWFDARTASEAGPGELEGNSGGIVVMAQSAAVRHHPSATARRNLVAAAGNRETHDPGRAPLRLPPYFRISLEVAGSSLLSSNDLETIVQTRRGKPAGVLWGPYAGPPHLAPPILASAARREDGVEYLRCNVHLVSPQMLFARQRQRTALFGLLIGVSAAAALVGFVTARRAFWRQLRLADMKSNFVSSVSHELRAPIASVRLMAEGLERGRVQDPAKQTEYFRFIVQECRRLSSMIENVLDFSRIEQRRKQDQFEPTDLCALVTQTVKVMIAQAAERQIRLETVLPAEPFSAEVDGRAIQQALVNLLDNALKHSPHDSTICIGLELSPGPASDSSHAPRATHHENPSGDCGLRIADCGLTNPESATRPSDYAPRTTHHASGPRQMQPATLPPPPSASPPLLHLWVEDLGPGIPPAEHERIFERFYRCGSELRRETQGVGIGLSIVKHIVEAHGGKVLVRSAPGQGSRFTLELPLCPASS